MGKTVRYNKPKHETHYVVGDATSNMFFKQFILSFNTNSKLIIADRNDSKKTVKDTISRLNATPMVEVIGTSQIDVYTRKFHKVDFREHSNQYYPKFDTLELAKRFKTEKQARSHASKLSKITSLPLHSYEVTDTELKKVRS